MEEDQQPLSPMFSVESCSLNVGSILFGTNRYNRAGVATAKKHVIIHDPGRSNCDGT